MLLVFTGANSTSLDVDLIGERACHQESPRANVEAMRFIFLAAGLLLHLPAFAMERWRWRCLRDVSRHGKAVRTLGSPWNRHETELGLSRS